MSAIRAAQALLELDANLAAFAASIEPYAWGSEHADAVEAFVRHDVMNTWTLTLAARSADATEEQVISALLYMHPFRLGSTCVCRGRAKEIFSGSAHVKEVSA